MKKISLDEMKKIQLNILRDIDKVCRKNGIKYTLMGGSLIGLIRHKGFIPWDDDIDIAMTNDNYERFLKVYPKQCKKEYLLINNRSDKSYYLPFDKIVDSRTILFEDNCKPMGKMGVFVDLFVYSGISSNKNKQKRKYRKLNIINKALKAYAVYNKSPKTIKWRKKRIAKILLDCFASKDFLIEKNRQMSSSVIVPGGKIISNYPIYGLEKEVHDASIFDEYEDYFFEKTKVMSVKKYDEYLKDSFGDYMKMPPKEKRVPKHGINAYWK